MKTLEDAINKILTLENRLDSLSSKDIDMRKRRVVNAAPSNSDYDYVVRKELDNIIQQQGSGGSTVVAAAQKYTIVFALDGRAYVGTQLSPPFIITRPGTPTLVRIACVLPPSEGTAEFMLIKNLTTDILTAGILLPAGGDSEQEYDFSYFVEGTYFSEGDSLNIECSSIGTGRAPEKVTVEIVVQP